MLYDDLWCLIVLEMVSCIAGGGLLHCGRWLPECREMASCMSGSGFLHVEIWLFDAVL